MTNESVLTQDLAIQEYLIPLTKKGIAHFLAYLNSKGYSGFLLPKTDAHRSEYCPERDNLVQFLTGFSGSTGCAGLVLESASKAKGAIFVDGRYTIQARDEVDTDQFSVVNYTVKDVVEWFVASLKDGDKIAFDPQLLSLKEYESYGSLLSQHGIELIPLSENPLYDLWQDRPAADQYPLSLHPIQYSGVSFEDKLAVIREQMKALSKTAKTSVDGFFLNYAESIAWLFNVRAHDRLVTPVAPLYAYIPSTGPCTLFTDTAQDMDELKAYFGRSVIFKDYASAFEDHGLFSEKSIALDASNATMSMRSCILLQGGRIVETSDFCDIPRACKNKTEQEGAKAAHIRDGVAVCQLLSWLESSITHEKITELEVVDRLWQYRLEQDLIKGYSFDTISGSGPNGAIVHYRVSEKTNRMLQPDDIFLLDSGGQYLDGTTDITRTVSLNKKPTVEQKDRYTRVLKGHIALSSVKFPKGTTGSKLDPLARQYLWQIGADYAHGTGHGVGSYLGVHEGPQRISPIHNTVPLLPGMILSNEPGYYKTDAYGIRIENLVLVKKVSSHDCVDDQEMLTFENLTLVPLDKSLMDLSLLSQQEIDWVNDYHEQVRNTLMPLVPESVKEWLHLATESLEK